METNNYTVRKYLFVPVYFKYNFNIPLDFIFTNHTYIYLHPL